MCTHRAVTMGCSKFQIWCKITDTGKVKYTHFRHKFAKMALKVQDQWQ